MHAASPPCTTSAMAHEVLRAGWLPPSSLGVIQQTTPQVGPPADILFPVLDHQGACLICVLVPQMSPRGRSPRPDRGPGANRHGTLASLVHRESGRPQAQQLRHDGVAYLLGGGGVVMLIITPGACLSDDKISAAELELNKPSQIKPGRRTL